MNKIKRLHRIIVLQSMIIALGMAFAISALSKPVDSQSSTQISVELGISKIDYKQTNHYCGSEH